VAYVAVHVWRRPVGFGALLTAFVGARLIRKAAREWSIDVLMPRSNLPALACLLALKGVRLPVVFDADGLPLDERVDFSGASASGVAHRLLRDVEAEMVRRADRVLTRTQRAVEILFARGGAGTAQNKFHVVGNGRDAARFFPGDEAARCATRQELGIDVAAPLLVYAGSLGEQYCLIEMLQLFEAVKRRRAEAWLLILSGSPDLARAALSARPALNSAIVVKVVPADEVPRYLACADLGLALRRPSFSMQAVAPIKLGEYLLCGLPVVATAGIGDTVAISADAGLLLRDMDEAELKAAADWFIDTVLPHRESYRASSRVIGTSVFSLEASAASYGQALRHVGRKP
jgi:glycosyltransferase involved in cell wall biosynthesis